MLVCVIHAIHGAQLLVWKPMAEPIAHAEFVPQSLVDEMFVRVRFGQSVQSAPGCGAQASVNTLDWCNLRGYFALQPFCRKGRLAVPLCRCIRRFAQLAPY